MNLKQRRKNRATALWLGMHVKRTPTDAEIQQAFEKWVDIERPHGDAEDVQYQWVNSPEYLDLFWKYSQ